MTGFEDPEVYADNKRAAQLDRLIELERIIAERDVLALANLLSDTEKAHAAFEKTCGGVDGDWPTWYAEYVLGVRA